MQKYKRSRKLIQPGLQLRLVCLFTGIGTLALLLQFLIVGILISRASQSVEASGGHLADALPGILVNTLVFSLGMLVPVLFGIGILLTFRIAGPAHRMETFLRAVARGEEHGLCTIRKGDQLGSLCESINEAVTALRENGLDSVPDSAHGPAHDAGDDRTPRDVRPAA